MTSLTIESTYYLSNNLLYIYLFATPLNFINEVYMYVI